MAEIGIDISKHQQTSDWGAEVLTDAQLDYAASDVLHLHALKAGLEARLIREDGLRGMTSNPTIFEKAVAGSGAYDEDIRRPETFLGTPLLGDFLEEGLAQFGISCADVKMGRL